MVQGKRSDRVCRIPEGAGRKLGDDRDNDKYQQANKRLHRSGQTHAVSVIHILAKGTIDQVMLRSLQNKEKTNASLMGALDRRQYE